MIDFPGYCASKRHSSIVCLIQPPSSTSPIRNILSQFRITLSTFFPFLVICLGVRLRIGVLSHHILELRPQRFNRTEFIANLTTYQPTLPSSPESIQTTKQVTHSNNTFQRSIQLVDVGQNMFKALRSSSACASSWTWKFLGRATHNSYLFE